MTMARPCGTKYGNPAAVDAQFDKLRAFWDAKCAKLQVQTPDAGLTALTNQWTLYQSEINVMFSRFSSFIEVGGRTGLGYRDTAQDAMCVPHSNPAKCRRRIVELLRALTREGYGLHLFEPRWFDPDTRQQSFQSPTVVPTPGKDSIVHGIEDACADDALWLIGAIVNYVKETGELDLIDETVTYADGGEGTVYDHMRRILDFSAREVGANGICKGLRADWNDCLNLGGGESAMVSFSTTGRLHSSWSLPGISGGMRMPDTMSRWRPASGRSARRCSGTGNGISGASPPTGARSAPIPIPRGRSTWRAIPGR